jgi:hypothetical protein
MRDLLIVGCHVCLSCNARQEEAVRVLKQTGLNRFGVSVVETDGSIGYNGEFEVTDF